MNEKYTRILSQRCITVYIYLSQDKRKEERMKERK